MTTDDHNLCVLMLGTAPDAEAAAELVLISSDCPYVAAYTARERLVMAAYVLPEGKRWWIEGIQERPELLGLEKASLVFTEYSEASSPWSRGEAKPVLETPPCGTRCDQCGMYGEKCAGCPASRYCRE